MQSKTILRIFSLIMFIIAVVFVFIALSCPTCGSVFYIGSIRIGSEVWRVFYAIYAIVMVLLFVASFFVPKKK